MIYWAVAAYSTYFWFYGYQFMQPLEPGCEPIAWLFIKVPFFGWYQMVLEVISSVAFGTFTLLFFYFMYTRGGQMVNDSFIGSWRRKKKKKQQKEEEAKEPEVERPRAADLPEKPKLVKRVTGFLKNPTGKPPKPAEDKFFPHKWTPACCIFVFACAVAAIECMIVWNGITGVGEVFSTGQLIPLVTGVGGLLSELHGIWDQPKVWSLVMEKKKQLRAMQESASSSMHLTTHSPEGSTRDSNDGASTDANNEPKRDAITDTTKSVPETPVTETPGAESSITENPRPTSSIRFQ